MKSVAAESDESDQENEPPATNAPKPADGEPAKKKTKLGAKRTVGKKAKP